MKASAVPAPVALSQLDDALLNLFDGICYTLDPEGVILAIGPDNWNRFAESAGPGSPAAAAVKGASLFDLVAGEEVRAQIRRVMDRLAAGKALVWVTPYRCDAPDRKRNMRFSIRPIREGAALEGFLCQSVPLEEKQRPPLDLFDFETVRARMREEEGLPIVAICSYCQRVRDQAHTGNDWAEAESYYAHGGTASVRLSHGICPDCKTVVFGHLED